MAGQTRVWQVADSWSKVAYAYYGDSREFRQLFQLNPGFDIRTSPAQGVPIFITDGSGSLGKTSQGGAEGLPGTLNQLSLALNLNGGSNPNPETPNVASAIFPWTSLNAYAERLSDYTAASYFFRDKINGYSLDSPEASTDTLRG